MKKSLLIIATLLLTLQAQAGVSAKELGAVDNAFEMTKSNFDSAMTNVGDNHSYMEGKIIAEYINIIDSNLEAIEKKLSEIFSLEDVEENDIEELKEMITEVSKLINEL